MTVDAPDRSASELVPDGPGSPQGNRAQRAARLRHLVSAAPSTPTYEVRSPFDDSLIGELPLCTEADLDGAVQRARRAQKRWAARPLAERQRIILRFHGLVIKHRQELLDITQDESGKARISAFEELFDIALTSRFYGRAARRLLKDTVHQGAFPFLTWTVETHQPKGLVGVIAPWNYPLTLSVTDAIPALLAGNGIILKPDRQTPYTALRIAELLREAGVPGDLFQVVTGSGSALGQPLIDRVDYLMFTGSTQTGRTVASQCGEALIGFSGELGGKNAMLVLADADIPRAVQGAIRGCFANAGQLCISIERIYVHRSLRREFQAQFLAAVREMRLGSGHDWGVDMGSLSSAQQLENVRDAVEDALARGATLLAGGNARPDLGPYFYEPTVLADVTPEMFVHANETFGPVVSIYTVDNDEEAVAAANDTEYGLNSSVWGTPAHAERVGRLLRTGTVNVNEAYQAGWGSHASPMGGMRASGLGRRHGTDGILKYTESQTIATQRLLPLGSLPLVDHQNFSRAMVLGAQVLRRLPFYS